MKKKHFSLFLSISFSISLSLSSPSLTTYSLRNSITLQKIVNGWITGTYSAVANIWYIFFCFDNQSTFSSCQWPENLKAFCLGIQKQTLKISEDSNNSKSCFWCSLLSESNFSNYKKFRDDFDREFTCQAAEIFRVCFSSIHSKVLKISALSVEILLYFWYHLSQKPYFR